MQKSYENFLHELRYSNRAVYFTNRENINMKMFNMNFLNVNEAKYGTVLRTYVYAHIST